jgi:DedD protein
MEQKKVLWTVVSVVVFLVVVVAVGLVVFYPKKDTAKPAVAVTGAPSQNPNQIDPEAWVRQPETVPGFQAPPAGGTTAPGAAAPGSVTVTYGQQPETAQPAVKDTGSTVTVDVAPAEKPAAVKPAPIARKPETPKPQGQKIQSAKKPAPVSASVAKPVAKGQFWIQAGSFKSKAKAEQAKTLLGEKGLSSLITTKAIGGIDYYRVRIGPYVSKTEADSWLEKVKTVEGLDKSFVSKAGTAN